VFWHQTPHPSSPCRCFGTKTTYRDPKPSWDEIKSQLDPEQLAELEKHMKKPGTDH
jgi:hypothetical protein